ncbi:hypothetical protein E6P09_16610 (plasmid) [Haloferax mediterranei ATCC 33500]|nr:hypothetical protein C439_18278 [Haloferax mediterranei ATCC 33500]QCQ77092.1 hypothetical protein E6P09_16610 [Haloferax mediterranei ATCC 33500]
MGFALIFGVVMLAIVLVSMTVYPAIADIEDHQRVSNVERGMESLADNVDDLVRNDAPSRSTRLRLTEGQFALGEPITVTVNGTDAGGDSFSETQTVRPLVYRSGEGTELVYVNGAVVRDDGDGVVMASEPRLLVSNRSVVLPIVNLQQGSGPSGVEGTMRVVTVRKDARVVVAENTPHDVDISITSPRAEAWRRTFEARDGVTCGPISGDTLTCSVNTERVYVTATDIDVAYR